MTPVERLEQLGRAGLTVSVCYGPSGPGFFCRWSVSVLTLNGDEFEQPFAALSFGHAVQIAEVESVKRGWLRMMQEPEGSR